MMHIGTHQTFSLYPFARSGSKTLVHMGFDVLLLCKFNDAFCYWMLRKRLHPRKTCYDYFFCGITERDNISDLWLTPSDSASFVECNCFDLAKFFKETTAFYHHATFRCVSNCRKHGYRGRYDQCARTGNDEECNRLDKPWLKRFSEKEHWDSNNHYRYGQNRWCIDTRELLDK